MPAAASWYAEETVHSAPFVHWEVELQLLPRAIKPDAEGVEVEMGKIDIMPEALEETEMGMIDIIPEAVEEGRLARYEAEGRKPLHKPLLQVLVAH
jgi:hypothetical protein